MSTEEKIKALILEKHRSLRAFTTAINVPYSTIDSMLKRGIGGASVSVVVKVCAALEICVDSIAHGKIEPANISKDMNLTIGETEHIKKYRKLSPTGQAAVDRTLEGELALAYQQEDNLLSEHLA